MEDFQVPQPAPIYGQPYYTTPPAAKKRNNQTSMVLIGLVLGMVGIILLGCAGIGLYALGVFGEEIKPTPRPTTAAQQTATALVSVNQPTDANTSNGVLFPTTAPNTSPTQVAVQNSSERRQFAYAASDSGNLNIYMGDLIGSERIQLTSGIANETGPAFSPDGTQIAYYAYEGNNGAADIWLMSADGSNTRRITNTASADERVVAWSTDGTKLAYHSNADGDFDIYVFDVNTGQTRNLTNSAFDDLGPSWSPDGTRIAFHSDEDRNFNEIFAINIDGSERDQLTDGQWQAAFPAWSPDGSRVAFHAITADDYNIYTINADGEGFQSIFQVANNQRHPDWSRDGQALIYMVGPVSNPRIAYTDFLTGETRDVVSSGFFPDWKP
jgi:Tol biopolymer transport system component